VRHAHIACAKETQVLRAIVLLDGQQLLRGDGRRAGHAGGMAMRCIEWPCISGTSHSEGGLHRLLSAHTHFCSALRPSPPTPTLSTHRQVVQVGNGLGRGLHQRHVTGLAV
jgi:hypothetical protein